MFKLIPIFIIFIFSCSFLFSPAKNYPAYKRKDWRHWTDSDKDCQNTRHEILIERSLIPVSFSKKNCKVKTGQWEDYYYPEVHTKANKVDIDHLIPLKHAHDTGGANWAKKEKERFANDPENLVITDRKYNRLKGSKGIDEWLPVHKNYACKYVKDWMKIKFKYRLEVSSSEEKTIKDLSCDF